MAPARLIRSWAYGALVLVVASTAGAQEPTQAPPPAEQPAAPPAPTGQPQDVWIDPREQPAAEDEREPAAMFPEHPEPPPRAAVDWLEPPAPAFGAPGSFVVTSDADAYVDSASYKASDAKSFQFGVAPWFDYFAVRNLSFGVGAGVSYLDSQGYAFDGSLVERSVLAVSGGVRVGLNVPIGRLFSLYPRASAGVEWTRTERSVLESASVDGAGVEYPKSESLGAWVSASVPLLYHPRPHFLLGLGPTFLHAFEREDQDSQPVAARTAIGASFLAGVWWGGASPPEQRELRAGSQVVPPEEHRFGRPKQLVLSSETALYVSSLTLRDSDTHSTAYAIAPSADYFVTEGMSVGFALSLRGSDSEDIDTATREDTSASRYAIGASFAWGNNVPISRVFSFYPKLWLGIEAAELERSSGGASTTYEDFSASIGVYAPVLVHVASHAFIGFGPNIDQDLVRSVSVGSYSTSNRRTSFGAGLVIGGWIDLALLGQP